MTEPTSGATAPGSTHPVSRPQRTLTIASLATLATFLDTTILFVAFPAMAT